MTICYIHFLKLVMDDGSFPLTKRPFQDLAPLKVKHFWLVIDYLLGIITLRLAGMLW